MTLHYKDKTGLFTVVGAPYVPERHAEGQGHLHKDVEPRKAETGIAGLWLVFYALLGVAALVGRDGFGKAYAFAVALFN
jgi:hypothetical protein